MQDLLSPESNDEIDLRDVFNILWVYKFFITVICALCIIYSGYYALTTDKKYTSTAIFQLGKDNASGISLGRELTTLANIAGYSTGSDSPISIDQINGRIFIQKLDAKLNFQADPYFNKYSPNSNSVDPIWKSLIKRAIGWQKSPIDTQEAIWQEIVGNFTKNILVSETQGDSIKISATHESPQRAAKIANIIMDEIISYKKNRRNTQQDKQLTYLSNTLAKALTDLEISQSNLKEFALKSGSMPLESFAVGSLQLDALREQLSRTSKLHEAVAALLVVLQNKTQNQNDYLALRQKFPIVDQVEFRRVLGQNEIISSWNWPEASSVSAVFDTLSERKSRLQSQINTSQKNAERSGLALETYARLEREAKIAEASYTVLIEQVKAQSMAAGYRPDQTEIFEYASASINPSFPNRKLVLVLGAFFGLFIGAVLSLVLAYSRGVYYSKKSLRIATQARLTANIKTLLPLRNKTLDSVSTMLLKKPRPILRNMTMEIHKSALTQVVVTSSGAKMTSNSVARALASYMQSKTMKIAVINFSSKAKKLDIDSERLSVGSFVVVDSTDHISVLKPDIDLAAMELLSHRDFWKKIKALNSTFDLVFLCADNFDAVSLLSALEGQKVFHITIAKTKKTKSTSLMHMRSLLPIQGLFYD